MKYLPISVGFLLASLNVSAAGTRLDIETLVSGAELIVLGEVTSIEYEDWPVAHFSVSESIAGTAPPEIFFGASPDWTCWTCGLFEVSKGQRLVLFLTTEPPPSSLDPPLPRSLHGQPVYYIASWRRGRFVVVERDRRTVATFCPDEIELPADLPTTPDPDSPSHPSLAVSLDDLLDLVRRQVANPDSQESVEAEPFQATPGTDTEPPGGDP